MHLLWCASHTLCPAWCDRKILVCMPWKTVKKVPCKLRVESFWRVSKNIVFSHCKRHVLTIWMISSHDVFLTKDMLSRHEWYIPLLWSLCSHGMNMLWRSFCRIIDVKSSHHDRYALILWMSCSQVKNIVFSRYECHILTLWILCSYIMDVCSHVMIVTISRHEFHGMFPAHYVVSVVAYFRSVMF